MGVGVEEKSRDRDWVSHSSKRIHEIVLCKHFESIDHGPTTKVNIPEVSPDHLRAYITCLEHDQLTQRNVSASGNHTVPTVPATVQYSTVCTQYIVQFIPYMQSLQVETLAEESQTMKHRP